MVLTMPVSYTQLDNCSILIKLDVRTVFTTSALYGTNYNCFYYITFFYNAAWCCIFNGSNNHIADLCISSGRTAHNTNAK